MLTLVPNIPRPKPRAPLSPGPELSFEDLRDLGREAVDAGELDVALSHFDQALELARAAGDPQRVDLAVCNRGAVLITLGRPGRSVPGLRQILMTNLCIENSCLAAFHLSRALAREKASKKALFYSQVARDRAIALGREEWLATARNQLGNCLTDESRFREAAAEYQRALAHQPETRSASRAMLFANLGYCRMVDGKIKEGMSLSFRALRWFRYLGARVYEVVPSLDLCYAYIELGRYDRAREHGLRGLALAEESGESERVKIALYLLGDVEKAAGHYEDAYDYFWRLQQEFYPESPQLPELMLVLEMRQIVNLRA